MEAIQTNHIFTVMNTRDWSANEHDKIVNSLETFEEEFIKTS